MNNLTPQEYELAQQVWLNSDRETAIISAAFGIIIKSNEESWVPWAQANDLGIPYSLGIEMGDIEEKGLSPKGRAIVHAAYKSLCENLDVTHIKNVQHLDDLLIIKTEVSNEIDTETSINKLVEN